MKPMMMIAAGLLVAACGGSKADGQVGAAHKVDTASAEFREARALTTMRNDLRNLVAAEEAYFADHGKYTANLEAIILAGKVEQFGDRFPTPGNSAPHITLVGGGFTATIQNPNTRKVCAIFVGTKTPIPPATIEGSPACG